MKPIKLIGLFIVLVLAFVCFESSEASFSENAHPDQVYESDAPSIDNALLYEDVVEYCEPALLIGPGLVYSEMYAGLSSDPEFDHERSLEWSQFFTSVAVLETGFSLSEGCGSNNNIFGIKWNKVIGPEWATGYDRYGLCKFDDVSVCINLVLHRIFVINRPHIDESPADYLTRTNWNPDPDYVEMVRSVNLRFVCPDLPSGWKI